MAQEGRDSCKGYRRLQAIVAVCESDAVLWQGLAGAQDRGQNEMDTPGGIKRKIVQD